MTVEPGLGDFIKQPGVLNLLILIVGFGAAYVVLLAVILRRGAARRQKRRDTNTAPQIEPQRNFLDLFNPLPAPVTPLVGSGAAVSTFPEPTLEMLLAGLAEPVEQRAESIAIPLPPPSATPAENIESHEADAPHEDPVPVEAENAVINSLVVYEEENAVMQPNPENTEINLGDTVEVMRILRDINDGSLIIAMGGGHYRHISDIQSPDLSRRFSAVVRELWAMIGGAGAPVNPPRANNTIPPVVAPPDATKLGRLTAEPEKQRPHMLRQVAKQVMGQSDKQTEDPTRGIANAVEEFLQFKLANTPTLASRSIHIRPAPNHGVKIEVDGHYYDNIEDVVDADIRDFLFSTMKEWEARQ
jgi:hypothetical protein